MKIRILEFLTDTAGRKAAGAYCRDLFAALQDALVKHTLGTGPYLNKAHDD